MPQQDRFLSALVAQLGRRGTRAVLGLRGFRSDPLREYLRACLGQPPGQPGALLADPVLEASFGWQPADVTLGGLTGTLLHPDLVRALREPERVPGGEDYRFPARRRPYRHQLQAWQAARDGLSVLVTSGTGSGKTECFLIPILDDLARELEERQGAPLTGIRAIFLYPLNALIKSQQERLIAWTGPFAGGLRFCLYNGDTPEHGHAQRPCEVPDRRTLRNDPPPLLVTNATMLEYMLVRNEDRPILDQSQGRLRWVVIDEAHSYMGSQAAELTLLLRRVLHAFGARAEQVRFIATSATLGDGTDSSRARLAEFLADVAGVGLDRVQVVQGHREVPALPAELMARDEPCGTLAEVRAQTPAERFASLAGDGRFRGLRAHLVERPDRLSRLATVLLGRDDTDARLETLEWADLCTQSVTAQGQPFLPLRAHLFQRTVAGLWACANDACPGRQNTRVDDPAWPFGALFFERRQHCPHCEMPVFELVQCDECGAEYLAAAEAHRDGQEWLEPQRYEQDEDDFQQELEPITDDEADGDAAPAAPAVQLPRLLTSRDRATQASWGLGSDGRLDPTGQQGVAVHLRFPGSHGLECAVCHERSRDRALFRPVRIGAPFMLGTAIPALLEAMPPSATPADPRPLDGRRLITFTDSRQGTARFAAKLQQEAERDYVRSFIYHQLASAVPSPDPAAIEQLRREVEQLGPLAEGNAVVRGILEQKRQELDRIQAPALGALPWSELENKLLATDELRSWVLPELGTLTFGLLNERQLVHLCLLREFFLRPRRQFSLEGLGLVQLRYPALAHAAAPAAARQRGVNDEEWRTLLQVAVDYWLRSGRPAVQATDDIVRWLGFPARASFLVQPGVAVTNRRVQRPWPSTRSAFAGRNRLIRLLSHAFSLELANPEHARVLDELLIKIWDGLGPLLSPTADGFQLELHTKAVLSEVREAWFCPVTRRLLPAAFCGITPYLPPLPVPDALVRCQPLTMPRLPHPFWRGQGAEAAEAWLESDPDVLKLRALGAWPDLSDRLARYRRFLRAVEHSAQIGSADLIRRTAEFKAGRVNLLSCSTTMEMGVDIGGLTAVAMNNVPPHPANFLQRAGRAGRRGETAALSFTLCKATPQGEAVFQNPLWAFETRLGLPRVSLQSEPIVQRHINALALATFLRDRAPDIRRLRTGGDRGFFEAATEGSSAPAELFADWCDAGSPTAPELPAGIARLTARTVLDGRTAAALLSRTATALRRAAARWRADLDALLAQQQGLQTRDGDSKPEKAIRIQLERLRREYLLGELANLRFLPGYGFPTDVVPFVTTTMQDLNQPVRGDREDNRAKRAGYPSRHLSIAIRDYAPGTDTVLDGRVYRSGGVTLNWQVPVHANAAPELQNLRWAWRCRHCGGNGTRLLWPEHCPSCGANAASLDRRRYLQPAGFAVDIRCKPHNDITIPQYIPVRDPLVSLDGADWMPLPDAALGRYRSSTEATIYQYSEGLHGRGYALCLRCGLADSMLPDDRLPASFVGSVDNQGPLSHKRLRGGRLNDNERQCPGNDTPDWAIPRGVRLGVVAQTEVFELQPRDAAQRPLDRVTAFTLAVALRRALCGRLGIEEGEVGVLAAPSRMADGEAGYSLYLYDTATGGAGYARQTVALLPELLRDARDALHCPRECDAACQACLLTHDTQHHVDDLDRKAALDLLTPAFLHALDLPETLRAFGAASRLELEPLSLAMNREAQRLKVRELRVFLGGNVQDWEPLAWRLRGLLERWSNDAIRLRLVMPAGARTRLDDSQSDALAALLAYCSAELLLSPNEPPVRCGGLPLMIELGSDAGRVRWAAASDAALVPGTRWGGGELGGPFARAREGVPLTPLPPDWLPLSPAELRSAPAGAAALSLTRELDGSAGGFGQRAWALLAAEVPALGAKLKGAQPLQAVQYTDRYLRSPLMFVLLHRLLHGLGQHSGGIGAETHVRVDTATLDRPHPGEPRLFSHDWRDAFERREIIETWYSAAWAEFGWHETHARQLPHARELRLTWPDGECWSLRFDQGLGYWRIASRATLGFPFAESPRRQVEALASADPEIEASNQEHATYWYCCRDACAAD
jgi:DEAD/DEAH box helicase domain-containing protein